VTAEEALQRVQALWGKSGAICNDEVQGEVTRLVGVVMQGHFVVRGRGGTWEAALHDAETNPPQELMRLA